MASYIVEKAVATIDSEIAWLEKLNEEKCDIEKAVYKLKKGLRIYKRFYVECARHENGYPEEIEDYVSCIEDIVSINMLTKTYKRMILRLLEQIKRCFLAYEYTSDYYYSVSDATVEAIDSLINLRCLSNRKLNIFFTNVDDKTIITDSLKDRFNIYASAINEDDYSDLKSHVDYRILGELKLGTFITNNAFDVLVMRPKLESRYNTVKDSEKMEIINNIRFLREDGLLVLNIPYSRCSDDLLLLLSKKLKNIRVSKIQGCYTERAVLIVGNKASFKSEEDYAFDYRDLMTIFDLDFYKELSEERINFAEYSVPSDEVEITFFRGSKISREEMCDYCINSGLVDSFFDEEENYETRDRHPLLPFNIGQVGLVLTSSELNGIVEDENGIPHLIKGMTVKDTKKSDEHEGNEIKSTEVVANRVQINIMSADGKIIKIS